MAVFGTKHVGWHATRFWRFNRTVSEQKGKWFKLPTLIGIEEPETALHAIAMDALMEALREASEDRQIIVTTHSTELLDCEIDEKCLLPVALKDSETRIGGLDEGVKKVLIDRLATPGELLRQKPTVA